MSLPNQLRCYFFWLMFSVSIANLQKNTWTDLRHMHEVAPTTFSCGVIVCGILARCTWCCAKIGVHTVFLLARVVFPRKLGKRDVVPETKHNFSQKIVGTIFGNMTKNKNSRKFSPSTFFLPNFLPKISCLFRSLHFVQIWLGVQGCPSQRPSVFSGVFFLLKEKFMGVLPDKQNTNGFFYRGLVIDLAVFERLDPDLCRNRLIFLGKTPSLGFGNPLKKDR